MKTLRQWIRTAVCIFILMLIVLLGGCAYAGEFQAEAGQCRMGLAPNGFFYQEDGGMNHHNYMTPRCGAVAYAAKFPGSNYGWRVSAMRTDHIEARSNIARFGDDQSRQQCVPGVAGAVGNGCRAMFNGYGYTYGFTAGLTDEHRFGPVAVIGEAGLFYFRHRFHAAATTLDDNNSTVFEYDAASSWTAPPEPYLGLSLKYDHLYVAVRHYFPTGHRTDSLTDDSMTQLMVGVSF